MLQAKQIQQQLFGTVHRNTKKISKVWLVYSGWKENGKRLEQPCLKPTKSGKKLLAKGARHLSERELTAYIQKYAGELSRDFSLHKHMPGFQRLATTMCFLKKDFYSMRLHKCAKPVSPILHKQQDSIYFNPMNTGSQQNMPNHYPSKTM